VEGVFVRSSVRRCARSGWPVVSMNGLSSCVVSFALAGLPCARGAETIVPKAEAGSSHSDARFEFRERAAHSPGGAELR
jgi:hypothetical protein